MTGGAWTGKTHTGCVKLLEFFVVLSTQLGPFRKLVLAARGAHFATDLEIFCLECALLRGSFGRGNREVVDQRPDLHPASVTFPGNSKNMFEHE